MSRLTRRDVLGGGVLLSLLAVTGCASRRTASGGLPDMSNLEKFLDRRDEHAAAPEPEPPSDLGLPSDVIPRSEWTSVGIARPREIFPMGGINRITVHHDGMPPVNLKSRADAADRIEVIRRSHVQARGFADIGYHYVIDPQGRIWQARPVKFQGAHVRDNNEHNLGVLVLGNFELQTPTAAATASVDRFVASQMDRYNVPLHRVFTHREIVATTCPGRNLQRYMVGTRTRSGGLARVLVGTGNESLLG